MQPYLTDLTWFSLFLLIGILISIISAKIKISDVLLLLLVGILFGIFKPIELHPSFITGFSIFALIMIIFSSTSKFKLREISSVSPYAIKLSLLFFISTIVLLTSSTHLLFKSPLTINAFLISGLFASLMSGTSPSAVLSLLKDQKNKLIEILEFESILNTPLMVLIPLVILDIYQGTIIAQQLFTTFLQSITTGVGTGVVLFLELSFLTTSIPSLFIRGVPASSQSAPPFIESFAIASALCSFRRSRATCRIGFIKLGINTFYLKDYGSYTLF